VGRVAPDLRGPSRQRPPGSLGASYHPRRCVRRRERPGGEDAASEDFWGPNRSPQPAALCLSAA
jgi:hypothetical protein